MPSIYVQRATRNRKKRPVPLFEGGQHIFRESVQRFMRLIRCVVPASRNRKARPSRDKSKSGNLAILRENVDVDGGVDLFQRL